jgi:hypothetical protein
VNLLAATGIPVTIKAEEEDQCRAEAQLLNPEVECILSSEPGVLVNNRRVSSSGAGSSATRQQHDQEVGPSGAWQYNEQEDDWFIDEGGDGGDDIIDWDVLANL